MNDITHPSRAGIRKLLARATLRAAMPVVVMLLLGALALVSLGHAVERHIGALETGITNLGPLAGVAFIALFVVATSLLVPDSVLCVVAGALFGVGWGFVAVVAGCLLAGVVQFALAHRLLRGPIQRALENRPALAAIQHAVVHDELRLQVLLRLTPINPAIVSYLLGAAGVRFTGFFLGSLALTPTLFVEVYLGHAGKHLLLLSSGSTQSVLLRDALLLGGLVLCIAVLLFVSKMAHKALLDAMETVDGANSQVSTD